MLVITDLEAGDICPWVFHFGNETRLLGRNDKFGFFIKIC